MTTCLKSHQCRYLHHLLLLHVQLFVFDIQYHLEALQLLFQIQRVGVLLRGQLTRAKMFRDCQQPQRRSSARLGKVLWP